MSYDLVPANKELEEISMGAFSWPIILQETGMGYILGYGAGRTPATYVFTPAKNGGSPASNDKYKVSATQAKAMAMVARGFISVKEFINKEWQEMTEEDREFKKKFAESWKGNRPLYLPETGQRFLDEVKKFAEFAEKSKGFKIY
ncbi:MAG TPA: hypothetical protein DCL77_14600 [Prolixibacteraceae bacterium]|jgi:hypothetical protein|nr:hypothetical protein [Prolixibacteraceae bacterium]